MTAHIALPAQQATWSDNPGGAVCPCPLNHEQQTALLRIFQQLHRFTHLDELLEFLAVEVQQLLHVGGAIVLLLDETRQEFFFRVAALDRPTSGERMRTLRFPVQQGVAGYVFRTGEPLIVPDTSVNPYFLKQIDEQAEYATQNMLDVPIATPNRRLGVLCVVNKQAGAFTPADVNLLSTIASTIALPIENASIHDALNRSYEEVKSLNRAKDRVIHHLAHELKTPASVLSASFKLLSKRLTGLDRQENKRILERAQRNLQRILDMQYEVEDILREKDYTSYHIFSILLDACVDELDVLIADELGEWNIMQRVRRRIDDLFGPREAISRKIALDQFVPECLETLRPQFSHRTCQVTLHRESAPPVLIPPDVLTKIVTGLLRNAVENTPDEGLINVRVKNAPSGPQLIVQDYGIGMSAENQRLVADNYFPAPAISEYTSRQPYDFQAGGKGFDLLRMKIFSERYHFTLDIHSERCGHLPEPRDLCPGNCRHCAYCQSTQECLLSGGTTVTVQFLPTADAPSL